MAGAIIRRIFALRRRSIHGGKQHGVFIAGAGTCGRLVGCDVTGNKGHGVAIEDYAAPQLTGCK